MLNQPQSDSKESATRIEQKKCNGRLVLAFHPGICFNTPTIVSNLTLILSNQFHAFFVYQSFSNRMFVNILLPENTFVANKKVDCEYCLIFKKVDIFFYTKNYC